jgi:hypothetical protein
MNKEMAETEKYKKPLSPRAEEFIYQLAHKTELLEVENKKLLAENTQKNISIAELEARVVVIRGALETLLRWGLGRSQRKLVDNVLCFDAVYNKLKGDVNDES